MFLHLWKNWDKISLCIFVIVFFLSWFAFAGTFALLYCSVQFCFIFFEQLCCCCAYLTLYIKTRVIIGKKHKSWNNGIKFKCIDIWWSVQKSRQIHRQLTDHSHECCEKQTIKKVGCFEVTFLVTFFAR